MDFQDHDIEPPELPHYTLSGLMVDADDSTLTLANAEVTLMEYELLYDVPFGQETAQADSLGFFQIDSLTPGAYTLTASRDGYIIFGMRLSIDHSDRELLIRLPRLLFTYDSIRHWVSAVTWFDGEIFLATQESRGSLLFNFIDRGRINGNSLEIFRRYPIQAPMARYLDYCNGALYLYASLLVSKLSMLDASLLDSIVVPVAMHGLTCTEEGFWTVLEKELQFRGSRLDTIVFTHILPDRRLVDLAYSGEHFWTIDASKGWILKLTREGDVVSTYAIIGDEGKMLNPGTLDFYRDTNMMWVAAGKKYYRIFIPE